MKIKSNYNDYENVESVPAGACHRYVFCGNTTPGKSNNAGELCNECIDELRSRGPGYEVPNNAQA